jgi:hypothetical protein
VDRAQRETDEGWAADAHLAEGPCP